jgi:hypothetical protein
MVPMIIKLCPISSSKNTSISVSNNIITIDGVNYDLQFIISNWTETEVMESPFVTMPTIDHAEIIFEYISSESIPNQSMNENDYIIDILSGDVISPIVKK